MKNSIAACLIVKNESAMLARCLESVKEADAIYILDTGSSDNTVEIARQYTDNVYLDYVWIDDFADARNYLLNKIRGKETFVLSIDADEYLNVPFSEVRRAVDLAKTDMIRVLMIADGSHRLEFGFGRLFRNTPDIYWVQPIHKHLNLPGEGEEVGNVSIIFGHSPAHALDPNRTLRILEDAVRKSNEKGENPGRNLYYLGREYWYKQRYADACATLGRYVNECHSWDAERAESFLVMSQAYSRQGMDTDARDAILQAININSNFREAIEWMADISKPENAPQWRRMARTANNKNVMWDRTVAKPVHDVLFVEPHQDDSVLYGSFTLMRHRPLIVSVTSSFIQPNRGEVGCDADTRRKESVEAATMLGCPIVFMDIPDTELTEEIFRERIKFFNPETVYIPAAQGGNKHHDLINKVCLEVFGRNKCEQYSNYSKTNLFIQEGYEIKPTQIEMELKNKALQCYQSQLNLPSTRPHFEAVIGRSEWLL